MVVHPICGRPPNDWANGRFLDINDVASPWNEILVEVSLIVLNSTGMVLKFYH